MKTEIAQHDGAADDDDDDDDDEENNDGDIGSDLDDDEEDEEEQDTDNLVLCQYEKVQSTSSSWHIRNSTDFHQGQPNQKQMEVHTQGWDRQCWR